MSGEEYRKELAYECFLKACASMTLPLCDVHAIYGYHGSECRNPYQNDTTPSMHMHTANADIHTEKNFGIYNDMFMHTDEEYNCGCEDDYDYNMICCRIAPRTYEFPTMSYSARQHIKEIHRERKTNISSIQDKRLVLMFTEYFHFDSIEYIEAMKNYISRENY